MVSDRRIWVELCFALAVLSFFLEGALRKWVIGPDDPIRYAAPLAKVFFVLAAIVASNKYNVENPLRGFYSFVLGLPIIFVVAGATLSTVSGFSAAGAVLTLPSLIVLPVAACLLVNSISVSVVRTCMVVVGLSMIAMVPLVVVQFFSSRTDMINCYVGGSFEGVATTGFNERVRATGTFSYISGLTVASLIGEITGLYILGQGKEKLQKTFGSVVVFASFVCAFSTVSRAAIFATIGLFICWAIRGRVKSFVFLTLVVALTVLVVVIAEADSMLTDIMKAVIQRSEVASDNSTDRIATYFTDIWSVGNAFPLGGGLGTSQGVAGGFYVANAETEGGRLIYEVGILGWIGYMMIYLGAIIYLLRCVMISESRDRSTILVGCVAGCSVLMFLGTVFNHVAAAAFWGLFCSGAYLMQVPHRGHER